MIGNLEAIHQADVLLDFSLNCQLFSATFPASGFFSEEAPVMVLLLFRQPASLCNLCLRNIQSTSSRNTFRSGFP